MSQNDSVTVYEIVPDKKYVFTFDQRLSKQDVESIKAQIDDWLKNDNPFLLISGQVVLLRVQGELEFLAKEIEKAWNKAYFGEGDGQPVGFLNSADFRPKGEAEFVNSDHKWNVGLPGGPAGPFYSVVKSNGNIVAMQIPDEKMADLIATVPVYQAAAKAANDLIDAIAEFDLDPVAIGESVQALDYWLAKLGYITD